MFLLAALATLGIGAQAQDKVVVVDKNGAETAYNIDDVKRITFSDDALQVVQTDENGTTYAFDDVQKIVFQTGSTGISTAETTPQTRLTLTISSDGTRLTVNGWNSDEQAQLAVYATNGTRVLHQPAWNGQSVDISQLAHGIYVLQAGQHTAKFRK